MHKRVSREALIFPAVTAPIAVLCGGSSALWAVPALALAALIYCVTDSHIEPGGSAAEAFPAWMAFAELAFLTLASSRAAWLVTRCWPGSNNFPLFSLSLLCLAAFTAIRGDAVAVRAARVLVWPVAFFFTALLGAAIFHADLRQEAGAPQEGLPILGIALSAVCGLFLPKQRENATAGLWLSIGALSLAVLFVAWGKHGALPVLTAIKGVSARPFRRMEALASCSLTGAIFLLLTLLQCGSCAMTERLGAAREWALFPAALALSGVFVQEKIPEHLFLAGSTIFWGLFPLLTQATEQRKKVRKNGKIP